MIQGSAEFLFRDIQRQMLGRTAGVNVIALTSGVGRSSDEVVFDVLG
jgi:hypothetical protein